MLDHDAPSEPIRADNPYRAPTTTLAPVEIANEELRELFKAEEIRRQFLDRESAIKSLGLLFYLEAGLGLLATIGSIVGLAEALDSPSNDIHTWVEPALGVLGSLGFTIFLMAIGRGLRTLRSRSRWTAFVMTILILALMLIGGFLGVTRGEFGWNLVVILGSVIINSYMVAVLASGRTTYLFSKQHAAIIDQTPHLEPRLSGFVRVILILFFPILVVGSVRFLIGVIIRLSSLS